MSVLRASGTRWFLTVLTSITVQSTLGCAHMGPGPSAASAVDTDPGALFSSGDNSFGGSSWGSGWGSGWGDGGDAIGIALIVTGVLGVAAVVGLIAGIAAAVSSDDESEEPAPAIDPVGKTSEEIGGHTSSAPTP